MLLSKKESRKSLVGTQRTVKANHEPQGLKFETLEDRRVLSITLSPSGTYETGIFDESAAEIVAYDADTERLFVTNSNDQTVDVLDMSDPANPTLAFTLPTGLFGAPSSVAVDDGLVAVSVIADLPPQRGTVVFFETDGDFIGSIKVGRNPDHITFTPDGSKVLIADEGQPDDNYNNDALGTVTIIDASDILAEGIPEDQGSLVTTVGFNKFNSQVDELRAAGVRIFGPNATVGQDLEPEYIAVSPIPVRLGCPCRKTMRSPSWISPVASLSPSPRLDSRTTVSRATVSTRATWTMKSTLPLGRSKACISRTPLPLTRREVNCSLLPPTKAIPATMMGLARR